MAQSDAVDLSCSGFGVGALEGIESFGENDVERNGVADHHRVAAAGLSSDQTRGASVEFTTALIRIADFTTFHDKKKRNGLIVGKWYIP